MMRSSLIFLAMASSTLQAQVAPQAPTIAVAHHEPNFDSERRQANELFLAQKVLEALPLYEDLCRQDPTVAVFAERHAAGLFAKSATASDAATQQQRIQDAMEKKLALKLVGRL